jgi:hypothetical protein
MGRAACRHVAVKPPAAASCSAVALALLRNGMRHGPCNPPYRALTLQPSAASTATVSLCPSAAASCIARRPRQSSASSAAPAAASARHAPDCPASAARCLPTEGRTPVRRRGEGENGPKDAGDAKEEHKAHITRS